MSFLPEDLVERDHFGQTGRLFAVQLMFWKAERQGNVTQITMRQDVKIFYMYWICKASSQTSQNCNSKCKHRCFDATKQ